MDAIDVRLEPHRAIDDSPIGPAEIEHNQWMVYVHSPALNTTGNRLQVGWIGKHAGANFCPIPTFYKFVKLQQDEITERVKQLHGNASPACVVDVPPPIEQQMEEWDEDDTDSE